jgi:hypothetical protein
MTCRHIPKLVNVLLGPLLQVLTSELVTPSGSLHMFCSSFGSLARDSRPEVLCVDREGDAKSWIWCTGLDRQ